MKTIIPLGIMMLGVVFFMANKKVTSTAVSTNQIDWCENDKLIWDDYKGRPPRGNHYHARTVCEIGFNISIEDNVPKFDIICNFVKNKSWVKAEGKEIPELLKHEQLHFDIAEIHARKLRRDFQEANITLQNLERKADQIYEKNWNLLGRMQNAYDAETDHSVIKDKQIAWEEKVARLLKELEPYADNALCE